MKPRRYSIRETAISIWMSGLFQNLRLDIQGAKNIPFLEQDPLRGMSINPRFAEIVEKNFGKSANLICGCQKGGRSYRAAETLKAAGFQNVVDMRGGYGGETDQCGCTTFAGWAERGLPVTTESSREDRYEHLKSN